ncbi:hypothetical protein ZIOFF_074775 [Zingiber officinale]|uniref:Uncharacterized protein n=1 Tax=Zingiber officinale TaxID=94328 RepID=A0A8J5CQU0_ZINOF|nr:hypothetical protein ZIOFF_074775 [Zingiber officinale]
MRMAPTPISSPSVTDGPTTRISNYCGSFGVEERESIFASEEVEGSKLSLKGKGGAVKVAIFFRPPFIASFFLAFKSAFVASELDRSTSTTPGSDQRKLRT